MARLTELFVNGSKRPVNALAERSLLSVLRDDLASGDGEHRGHLSPPSPLAPG
jgi:hypothetical protein